MILTVAQLKEQLNFTADLGTADDALIGRKIAAAQNHIERLLGFKIETAATDGREGFEDGIPPALIEAVSQLAADWYENREATLVGVTAQSIPFGVEEIIREYRDFNFG